MKQHLDKMRSGNRNPDRHDTAVKPPGAEVAGGGAMPNRGQRLNPGYGASTADLNRGHLELDQPERYESPHPQRGDPFDDQPGGFLRRTGFSDER